MLCKSFNFIVSSISLNTEGMIKELISIEDRPRMFRISVNVFPMVAISLFDYSLVVLMTHELAIQDIDKRIIHKAPPIAHRSKITQ